MIISEKKKTRERQILSAFLKGNTKEHLLIFYADNDTGKGVSANETVRIKYEVDINPPPFATFGYKYRLFPIPYDVKLYHMRLIFVV